MLSWTIQSCLHTSKQHKLRQALNFEITLAINVFNIVDLSHLFKSISFAVLAFGTHHKF